MSSCASVQQQTAALQRHRTTTISIGILLLLHINIILYILIFASCGWLMHFFDINSIERKQKWYNWFNKPIFIYIIYVCIMHIQMVVCACACIHWDLVVQKKNYGKGGEYQSCMICVHLKFSCSKHWNAVLHVLRSPIASRASRNLHCRSTA